MGMLSYQRADNMWNLIVSSLSQFVTILWLLKYLSFMQQSYYFLWKRKYNHISLWPQTFHWHPLPSRSNPKPYSDHEVTQPGLCYFPSPLLHHTHPLYASITLVPPWQPFSSWNALILPKSVLWAEISPPHF